MWVARTETGSTVEKGVMGVGEGSVCASVQNMGLCVGGDEGGNGGGGYYSQAELDSSLNS